MPDRAGGNDPDPEELDRKLGELKEEIGTPKTRELTPLERLVAARQVEKRAQRKRDTRVLVVLGDLCGTRDGYIHPDYPQGPPPSVQPSGTPVNPYSLATPSSGPVNSCQATTGT